MLFKIGFERLYRLHADIGRITEHDVEAAARENFRKRGLPVEGAAVVVFIRDQAVAAFDALLKVLQKLAALRGFQPQRQLSDLDRLRIEIDAVQIAGEDFPVHLARIDRLSERCKAFGDAPIFRREIIEGGDKEGARAARGIDDGEAAQLLPVIKPNGAFHLWCPIVR